MIVDHAIPYDGVKEFTKGEPIWIKIGFDKNQQNCIVRVSFQNEEFMMIPHSNSIFSVDKILVIKFYICYIYKSQNQMRLIFYNFVFNRINE